MTRAHSLSALFGLILLGLVNSVCADDKVVPAEVTAAIKKLKNLDPKIKLNAIEELAPLAVDSPVATAALCNAMMSSSQKVAVAALQAIEKARPDLYKPLSTLVLDQNDNNRREALENLTLLGDRAAPCISVLHATLRAELNKKLALTSRSAFPKSKAGSVYTPALSLTPTQKACFATIRKINPEDVETVNLYKVIASPDNKFSYAKYEALSFLGDWAQDEKRRKEVYLLFKSALADRVCQSLAIQKLGEFGAVAKDSLQVLKALKLSPDARTRELATKAVDAIENS